jgi:hypothetical protein
MGESCAYPHVSDCVCPLFVRECLQEASKEGCYRLPRECLQEASKEGCYRLPETLGVYAHGLWVVLHMRNASLALNCCAHPMHGFCASALAWYNAVCVSAALCLPRHGHAGVDGIVEQIPAGIPLARVVRCPVSIYHTMAPPGICT